jgi:hypothetical protein
MRHCKANLGKTWSNVRENQPCNSSLGLLTLRRKWLRSRGYCEGKSSRDWRLDARFSDFHLVVESNLGVIPLEACPKTDFVGSGKAFGALEVLIAFVADDGLCVENRCSAFGAQQPCQPGFGFDGFNDFFAVHKQAFIMTQV